MTKLPPTVHSEMPTGESIASPAAPMQPTEAMLNAARDWSIKKYGQAIGSDAAIGCWQAMLAASPQAKADENE